MTNIPVNIDWSQVQTNYISTDSDFAFPPGTFYIYLMQHSPSGDELPFRGINCPNGGNPNDLVSIDLNPNQINFATSGVVLSNSFNTGCEMYTSDNVNSVIWTAQYLVAPTSTPIFSNPILFSTAIFAFLFCVFGFAYLFRRR